MSNSNHVCRFMLSFLFIFTLTGCGNVISDDELKNASECNSKVDKFRADMVKYGKLNDYINSSFSIDGSYPDYVVTLESNLDKALGAVCDNFNLSNSNSEAITEQQVRNALNDNILNSAEEYEEEESSYYLFKLFDWCGQPCKDSIVFLGDPQNKEEAIKEYDINLTTNYDFTLRQIVAKEDNLSYPFKFKWQ